MGFCHGFPVYTKCSKVSNIGTFTDLPANGEWPNCFCLLNHIFFLHLASANVLPQWSLRVESLVGTEGPLFTPAISQSTMEVTVKLVN